MNKLLLGVTNLMFFVGCDAVNTVDTFDTGAPDSDNNDTNTQTATLAVSDVDAAWDGTNGPFTITLSNIGSAEGFWLGMTQEGSSSEDPWTGEDCLSGYTTGSGQRYNWCHYFSGNAGELSRVSNPDSIAEGSSTLLSGALEDTLTYFIQLDNGTDAGPCYTWGEDTSVYSGAPGCPTVTAW